MTILRMGVLGICGDSPRWRLLLSVLAMAGSVSAESLSFLGETDKDPLTYVCGETIVFTFTLVDRQAKNAPVKSRRVAWTRAGDDGCEEHGTAVSDGPVTVCTKLDRPGFVHVVIRAVDADGKTVKGSDKYDTSAGADVWRIPATPPPADFNAFWDRELARMRSVPMNPLLVERDAKDPALALYEFAVNTIPGEGPATGLVAWPKNAAPGSLPVHVNVPGYGYGVVPVSNAAVKKGAIEMCITRHGEDPLASGDYHENLWTNVLQGYGWRNNNTRTGNDMFRMVMRDVRAVQFVKTLSQWDGTTLTVSGPSMGGYRSIALAALDPAVTRCTPSYTWMCDLSGSKLHGRLGGWLPGWTDELAYVDGVNLASRVTCPVDMCFGLADYVCPPSGQMVMIRNLRGPVAYRVTHGVGHGHGWGVNHSEYRYSKSAVVPGADGRSVWGGSLKGPRQAATGRFRLTQIGSDRWIVDPEGCPYRNLSEKVAADPAAPARPTPYVYVVRAESKRLGKDARAMRDPHDEAFKICLEWDLAGKRGIMHDPWCLGLLVDADVDFEAQSEALVRDYFAGTREGVKRLDQDLLYLGCRFKRMPPAWVEKLAREQADILCGDGCFVYPDTLHLPSPVTVSGD
jgi:cephalosporin-C deacetylase